MRNEKDVEEPEAPAAHVVRVRVLHRVCASAHHLESPGKIAAVKSDLFSFPFAF